MLQKIKSCKNETNRILLPPQKKRSSLNKTADGVAFVLHRQVRESFYIYPTGNHVRYFHISIIKKRKGEATQIIR